MSNPAKNTGVFLSNITSSVSLTRSVIDRWAWTVALLGMLLLLAASCSSGTETAAEPGTVRGGVPPRDAVAGLGIGDTEAGSVDAATRSTEAEAGSTRTAAGSTDAAGDGGSSGSDSRGDEETVSLSGLDDSVGDTDDVSAVEKQEAAADALLEQRRVGARSSGSAGPGTGDPLTVERRATPVSPDAPLRTFVVGDSQAYYLGLALREGRLSELLDVTSEPRHSTGLSRSDYFDWPDRLSEIVDKHDPELAVIFLGSNDWQSMWTPDSDGILRGSDEWIEEWSRQLTRVLDALEAPHRRVIWVSLPPTRSNVTREGFALMNQIASAVISDRGRVALVDTWPVFGGDAPYRAAIPPPDTPDGTPVRVRHSDGIHINQTGSGWVAEIVSSEIDRFMAEVDPRPLLVLP